MEIGSILLVLAVALLTGLYLSQPFGRRIRVRQISARERELSTLLAERDRVLNSLQELDFDHTLGKIPAEDYPLQRTELLSKGADILRRIDELQPGTSRGKEADRIEAAVAARRTDAAVRPGREKPAAGGDDDLESLIASRRSNRGERSGGFCPQCGKPVLASDRFCPHCGKPVK